MVSLGDAVRSMLARVAQYVAVGGNCESPIEVTLGGSIALIFERGGRPLTLATMVDLRQMPAGLLLVPQFTWGRFYRSDWAIVNQQKNTALLVECDGKDFHSTPEQKAHDLRKDTAALERGYLTMRFTGSQIFRDPDRCAQKVWDAVMGAE